MLIWFNQSRVAVSPDGSLWLGGWCGVDCGLPLIVAVVEHRDDVGMADALGQARLGREAAPRRAVGQERRADQLDRHGVTALAVGRGEDIAHPSRADAFAELVPATQDALIRAWHGATLPAGEDPHTHRMA